jgi:hypothetical protein
MNIRPILVAAAVAASFCHPAQAEAIKLDANCRYSYPQTLPPNVGSWSDLGADGPRVLEESRRQQKECEKALRLKQEKDRIAQITRPGEAVRFAMEDVVSFSDPTLGCPDVDDVGVADRQTAEWLSFHSCGNLEPKIKEWVVMWQLRSSCPAPRRQ